MAKCIGSEMGGSPSPTQPKSPPPQATKILRFRPRGLYRDKSFLHQKYVVERLSTTEIAKQIFSSRPTVLKWLRKHGIEVRPSGQNIRRRNLAYGRQLKKRRETINKNEVQTIEKMRELRRKGFSYRKIADVLNAMEVPTKTRSCQWQARTVQEILQRAKAQEAELCFSG